MTMKSALYVVVAAVAIAAVWASSAVKLNARRSCCSVMKPAPGRASRCRAESRA